MFEIEHAPTFAGSIKLKSLGRVQTLEVTFRAKTRDEYQEMIKSKTGVECFLELVEAWNANDKLDKAAVEKLELHQPGSAWAVVGYYGEQLLTAREGN